MKLYASGLSSNQVAEELGISQSGVMDRLRRMYRDYDVSTTQELCEKLGIEFVTQDRYELTRRAVLNEREKAVLNLFQNGYEHYAIRFKLDITRQQYVYAMKRLKKHYGVTRQKELLTVK